MVRLKEDGVPMVGFTWYSLTDQVDWDTALREDNGRAIPCGLYDLNRKIRPVGEVYRKLVAEWKDKLPVESLCLDRNFDDAWAQDLD
jgi:beta-glucosidase/6-phospho-beta-glucosidase/beta-galactosidase